MASKASNPLTRLKENILGTPEQNRIAQEQMDKAKKKKEQEESKKMAKGGAVKKAFKPCSECKSPAKCKAAGKCMMTKMAKGGKVGKGPVLAIMIGMPKAPKAKKK